VNAVNRFAVVVVAAFLASGFGMLATAEDQPPQAAAPAPAQTAPAAPAAPATGVEAEQVAEARLRSRLLHETIHGSLQVMHRDFFRDEKQIPSESMEDVFAELERTWQVKVKWLAVNAKAMNAKHVPATPFDRQAADAIAAGREMFDASADGVYQYAGTINLGNQCLKCHVPQRTSLEDRKAAVVISMPLKLRELTTK
jgi:hypothetical protein